MYRARMSRFAAFLGTALAIAGAMSACKNPVADMLKEIGARPAPDSPRLAVLRDGVALSSAASVDFGEVYIGMPEELGILVRNDGKSDLTFTAAPSLAEDAPLRFSIKSFAVTSIAAGASANLIIQFAPLEVGAKTATMAIESSDPASPKFTLSLLATGVAATAAAAPAFDPPADIYAVATNVSITCGTTGATIRYTVDGSEPTADYGQLYSGMPVPVTGPIMTIKAIAYRQGLSPSATSSASYVLRAGKPSYDIAAGTYAIAPAVKLACATPGATIRYTTDGTDPSATVGTDYPGSAGIAIAKTGTALKAIALAAGFQESEIASATYNLQVPKPIITPQGGSSKGPVSVSLSCANANATIVYTTDGSEPTKTNGTKGAGPFTVPAGATMTVKAFAYLTDWDDSSAASAVFSVDGPPAVPTVTGPASPTNNPRPGFSWSSDSEAVNYRYRLDSETAAWTETALTSLTPASDLAEGTHTLYVAAANSAGTWSAAGTCTLIVDTVKPAAPQPDAASPTTDTTPTWTWPAVSDAARYSVQLDGTAADSWISVNTAYWTPVDQLAYGGHTLYVRSIDAAGNISTQASKALVLVRGTASAPAFSPNGGSIPETTNFSLSCANPTSGHTIKYTDDGSDPKTSATAKTYSAPLSYPAGSPITITAYAYAAEWSDSAASSAVFTFLPVAGVPVFDPDGGAYGASPSITITSSTSDATIFYTTDGTDPSHNASAGLGSTSSVTSGAAIPALGATATVKAIAWKTGYCDSAMVTKTYTINGKASAPTIQFGSSAPYPTSPKITLSSATSGAAIFYRTDGLAPSHDASGNAIAPTAKATNGGNIAAGALAAGSYTITAIAWSPAHLDSDTATSASFTVNGQAATPTINPSGGETASWPSITIGSTTAGGYIFYTTNGGAPAHTGDTAGANTTRIANGGLVATGGLGYGNVTITALAYNAAYLDSGTKAATFTVNGPLPTPTFAPDAGTYGSTQTVSLSCTDTGATIRYTTDGSAPSASNGTVFNPGSPISVADSLLVKAIATKSNWMDSPQASALYSFAGSGYRDSSFGAGGFVLPIIGAAYDYFSDILVMSDGRVLMAGTLKDNASNSQNYLLLMRYNADGSLDTSLGGTGYIRPAWDNLGWGVEGMELQPDGKILLVGSDSTGSNTYYKIARYTAAGAIDTSFGPDLYTNGTNTATPDGLNDGFVMVDVDPAQSDFGMAIALQPDGKIVAAGYSVYSGTHQLSLVRYTADGYLDTTFSGDGKVLTTTTEFPSGVYSTNMRLAIQTLAPNAGKILVSGTNGNYQTWFTARFNSDGSLDTGFGANGIRITDIDAGANSSNLYDMVLQSDDKFILGGYAKNGSYSDFSLARYNADGTLDTSFDGDGMLQTDISGNDDTCMALMVQPDGMIVAAGFAYINSDNRCALVRYTSAGALDTGFGTSGKAVTYLPIGTSQRGYGLATSPTGGSIILGGKYRASTNYDRIFVIRFND